MKKIVVLALGLALMFSLTACGNETQPQQENQQAEQKEEPVVLETDKILEKLKTDVANVTEITVFDENTDPNKNLGRPNQYTGKGNFFDDRVENDNAGTIEIFNTEQDCQDRYDYLCKMSDPELGKLGVNQYIYKYDLVVFRVSFDLSPSDADVYRKVMDKIIDQESIMFGE